MRSAILILAITLSVDFLPSIVSAVCIEPPVERAYSNAAMIFSGIAVRSVEIERGADLQYPAGAVAWTFRVGQLWKGENVEEVVVVTPRNQFFYTFEQGAHYVVYASLDFSRKGLRIAPCSRTTRVEWAIPERHSLGVPVVVEEELRLLPVSDTDLENFDGYDGRYVDARPDPE